MIVVKILIVLALVAFMLAVVVMAVRTAPPGTPLLRLPRSKSVVGTRPSVTRVLLGGLLLGPVGAIAGYAWRKKIKQPPA